MRDSHWLAQVGHARKADTDYKFRVSGGAASHRVTRRRSQCDVTPVVCPVRKTWKLSEIPSCQYIGATVPCQLHHLFQIGVDGDHRAKTTSCMWLDQSVRCCSSNYLIRTARIKHDEYEAHDVVQNIVETSGWYTRKPEKGTRRSSMQSSVST